MQSAKKRRIKTAIITSDSETPVDGIKTIPLWKFLTSQDPLLSLIPEEKISAKELNRLKKIKAEMDSGKSVPYSKDLF
ncbi:MAG: hypothetical protein WC408_03985 [Candidatus Micrarchaeia archaeon]|jgi:hypothetical protein